MNSALQKRMELLFKEGFKAADIAEPLIIFSKSDPTEVIINTLSQESRPLAAICDAGRICYYLTPRDSSYTAIPDEALLDSECGLAEVIKILDSQEFCFITSINQPFACISRQDLQKPPVRMWLFGMITICENFLLVLLKRHFPDNSWQQVISPGRLQKAQSLQAERARRGEEVDLSDCLQFGDKAQLLMKDPEIRADIGVESKTQATRLLKELESLRNNLAHSQDIVSQNLDAILTVCGRLDKLMTRL